MLKTFCLFSSVKMRRGFSLTELAIVMGVAGLVLSAIWVMGGIVWHNHQIYETTKQVVTVVQNIRDYYGPIGRLPPLNYSPTTSPIPSDTDIASDPTTFSILPIEMRVGSTIVHRLGGNVALTSNPAGLGQGIFRIAIQDLEQADCAEILMELPVLMTEVGARRLSTDNSHTVDIDLTNIQNPGGSVDLPFSTITAADWCARSGKNNEVRLDVKLRN